MRTSCRNEHHVSGVLFNSPGHDVVTMSELLELRVGEIQQLSLNGIKSLQFGVAGVQDIAEPRDAVPWKYMPKSGGPRGIHGPGCTVDSVRNVNVKICRSAQRVVISSTCGVHFRPCKYPSLSPGLCASRLAYLSQAPFWHFRDNAPRGFGGHQAMPLGDRPSGSHGRSPFLKTQKHL